MKTKATYKNSSLIVASLTILLGFTNGCNSGHMPPSPLEGRGRTSNMAGINGTGSGSSASVITGTNGGKLNIKSLSVNSSGSSISLTYIHPSFNIKASTALQVTSAETIPSADNSKDPMNNYKGENYSYIYVEGMCRSQSGNSCDIAYYSVYTVDYDASGTYLEQGNFAIAKSINGTVKAQVVNKTDTYLPVEEVEKLFNGNP